MKRIILVVFLSIFVTLAFETASYSEYQIIQLTNNSYNDFKPQVNNGNHIAWSGTGAGVFLYDGMQTIQIRNANDAMCAQINSKGHVVWMERPNQSSAFNIFLYDGTSVRQITNSPTGNSDPQMNDSGTVVWENNEIFLYNGTTIIQLTCARQELMIKN